MIAALIVFALVAGVFWVGQALAQWLGGEEPLPPAVRCPPKPVPSWAPVDAAAAVTRHRESGGPV